MEKRASRKHTEPDAARSVYVLCTNIEAMANGKNRIIVTELPYMVNKARLIEKIAELVKDKKIDGITRSA